MNEQVTDQLIQKLSALPSIFSTYEAEQTRVSIGSAGKNGVAHLTFQKLGEKTYLTDLYNELPAKILRELYYDPYLPGLPYVLFMNPTGGIVQGDRYFYKIQLNEGAEAFITDTMATKIYKMDLNYASKHVDVFLSKNARLEFLPREVMAFADSRWHQSVIFHVDENSRFLYSDIFCPGRIAREEFWQFDVYSSKMIIEKNGAPVLVDNVLYKKEDKELIDIIFGNNKFMMTTYWYSKKALEAKKAIEFGEILGGATQMPSKNGLVVKALSNDLEELKKLQANIWRVFRKTEAGTEIPELRMY